jgi:hypothetical protein
MREETSFEETSKACFFPHCFFKACFFPHCFFKACSFSRKEKQSFSLQGEKEKAKAFSRKEKQSFSLRGEKEKAKAFSHPFFLTFPFH